MLLPWLILIPFIAGLLCWRCEKFSTETPRWIALIAMCITLMLSLLLWKADNYTEITVQEFPHWKIQYLLPWIPRFGINIRLALDGFSLLMVVMTALLGILSILCSWDEIQCSRGFFYFNLLWISSSVIGIFLAIDIFLFFVFWEMVLIPTYFLVALWGYKVPHSKSHVTAATKFFIYNQSSGLFMLVSMLGLVIIHYNTTNIWTFNYEDLLLTPMSETMEFILMIGFFLAFAIKMPVIPLHGWLPDIHSQSPTAGSVDLAGILLKTAAYGLLRFNLPLFPNASYQFSTIAMWFGIVGIFYGSWMAFSQTDIKRLIAYASLAHMGFLLIAIYSGNHLAYQGAVIHMIANSLSSAGLFIICGQLYERLKTRDMSKMGGLWSRLKFIPAFSLFFAVSMLGIPGTGNFIGEFTILLGTFHVAPYIAIIAAFGLIFSSIYSLNMIQQTYYGQIKSNEPFRNTAWREYAILLLLVLLILILGFFPKPIIDIISTSMINISYWCNTKINTI